MAWASVGSGGASQNKVSGTTLVHTITIQAGAGTILVVWVACDNFNTTGANDITGITDSAGNTYYPISTLGLGGGGAALGVNTGLYYTQIATGKALTSGTSTITLTLGHAVTAKCISVWKFTVADGDNLVDLDTLASTSATTTAATVPTLTVTPIVVGELVLRLVGLEFTTAFVNWAASTGFTAITPIATSGGIAATNIALWGEFKVSTATSETSNPTTIGSPDNVSIFFPLVERYGRGEFFDFF